MEKRKNLTFTQRLQIETLINAKKSKKEIAEILGLHLCTIYRELKRGAYVHTTKRDTFWHGIRYKKEIRYSAQISQERYDLLCTEKGRPLKIGKDYTFVNYIEKRVVQDKISACAALGEIKCKNLQFDTNISKTTLYRYIAMGIFPNIKLSTVKKPYRQVRMKRAPKGVSIERRPIEIQGRSTFAIGKWIVFVERQNRPF